MLGILFCGTDVIDILLDKQAILIMIPHGVSFHAVVVLVLIFNFFVQIVNHVERGAVKNTTRQRTLMGSLNLMIKSNIS